MDMTKEVEAGQAVYSPAVLAIYDLYVFGLSNRFAWKCKTANLLQNYNDNISGNHLEIGVGSGFLLDRCRFPVAMPKPALGGWMAERAGSHTGATLLAAAVLAFGLVPLALHLRRSARFPKPLTEPA